MAKVKPKPKPKKDKDKDKHKAARFDPVPGTPGHRQSALGSRQQALGPTALARGPKPFALGLCADLRRGITDLRLRIRKTYQKMDRISQLIEDLYGEPTTDPATLTQLKLELSRLQEKVEQDQLDLDNLEIDYTYAGCGSQDGRY
ncbi:hypothetical protein [Streptomyces zaomyceticus]|uniref:hypothetical protein n=1 Tax=Streptomyces zaomyceticus TaxID=68286 RepID=UPI00344633D8